MIDHWSLPRSVIARVCPASRWHHAGQVLATKQRRMDALYILSGIILEVFQLSGVIYSNKQHFK